MKTKEEEKKENPISIFIAETDNTPDAAFRIFNDNKKLQQLHYSSTRIGGVKRAKGGYAAEIPEELLEKVIGKSFELKILAPKVKVIDGVIKVEMQDEKRKAKDEK